MTDYASLFTGKTAAPQAPASHLTPPKYRINYEIYPAKACIRETSDQCNACLTGRIRSIGRDIGIGRGDSKNYEANLQNEDER